MATGGGGSKYWMLCFAMHGDTFNFIPLCAGIRLCLIFFVCRCIVECHIRTVAWRVTKPSITRCVHTHIIRVTALIVMHTQLSVFAGAATPTTIAYKMFNVTHLLTLLIRTQNDLLSRRRPAYVYVCVRIWWSRERFVVSPKPKPNQKKKIAQKLIFYYVSITFYCMSLFSIDDATHRNQTFSYYLCSCAPGPIQP